MASQYYLGVLLLADASSHAEAIGWLKLAADQGHAPAAKALGELTEPQGEN
ncbi:hypothetical protein D3C72_2577100 [compost metagenome]